MADTATALRARLGPYFMVAADTAGKILGFALAEESREPACVFPSGASYLLLEGLYVAPQHRSKGIGSGLAAHACFLAQIRF